MLPMNWHNEVDGNIGEVRKSDEGRVNNCENGGGKNENEEFNIIANKVSSNIYNNDNSNDYK
jgi:hypothetical protein